MKIKVTLPKNLRRSSEESLTKAVRALTTFAQQAAVVEAQRKLSSSAQTYIRGLTSADSVKVQGRSGTLVLVGKFPQMLEAGAKPFDLKKMLKGRNYVDIPFRHGTPGSTVLKPMPKGVYDQMAANIMKAKSLAGGVTRTRGPSAPIEKGRMNSSSIYAGMTRITHSFKGGSQSTYFTFRRMSKKSVASSWMHPGLKGVNIFPGVAKEVRRVAPKLIADYLSKGI